MVYTGTFHVFWKWEILWIYCGTFSVFYWEVGAQCYRLPSSQLTGSGDKCPRDTFCSSLLGSGGLVSDTFLVVYGKEGLGYLDTFFSTLLGSGSLQLHWYLLVNLLEVGTRLNGYLLWYFTGKWRPCSLIYWGSLKVVARTGARNILLKNIVFCGGVKISVYRKISSNKNIFRLRTGVDSIVLHNMIIVECD